jgi:hypothetical protein
MLNRVQNCQRHTEKRDMIHARYVRKHFLLRIIYRVIQVSVREEY